MIPEEMAEEYIKEEVPFDTTESGEKLYTENDLKCAYLAGLKAGEDMNVATKWYYPSKGEYPRKEALYLCQWQDGEITADEIYIDGNGEPYFAGSVTFADIFAWKEIVLPEEKVEDEKEAK